MRGAKTLVLSSVSVLAVLVIATPFLMGIAIKHSVNQIISFYNGQDATQIKVMEYKRGWFSSDALLVVVLKRPELRKLSMMLSERGETFPENLSFTIQEHIKHGPVLLHTTPNHLLSFGMANIHHNIHLATDLAKFIRPLNLNQPIIQMTSVISFNGVLAQQINLAPVMMLFPDGESTLQFDGLKSDMKLVMRLNSIVGSFHAEKARLLTHGLVIECSPTMGSFNTQLLVSGFWAGHNDFSLPELSVHDASGKSISLSDLNVQSDLREHSGLLYGQKEINLYKVQMNDQFIGPVNLKVVADGIKSQGVSLFLADYERFMKEEHVYRGEFKEDLYTSVPKMIHPGSDLKISQFKINTPDGELVLTGGVSWPENLQSLPQSIAELMKLTDANSHLKVSIPLANALADLAIGFLYTQPVDSDPERQQKNHQAAVNEELHRNALTIAVLMQDDQVSREAGSLLLKMQYANAKREDYDTTLDAQLKAKQISASAARILRSGYRDVAFTNMSPDERNELLQEEFSEKIAGWIKSGYVKQDNNIYTIDMDYQKGVLKANGHIVPLEE